MLARLGVFILWLTHFLPFRVIVALGHLLGALAYLFAAERRRVGDINLKLCFPEMDVHARRKLLRMHFRVFMSGLIERGFLWWASPARINALIRVEGMEHFEAMKGRPAILLTPHFVGMDAGGQWLVQHVEMVNMYSKQKSEYLTDLINQRRSRFLPQHLYSRQDGLRPILKNLKENRPFLYPPDQDQGVRDGAFIPFFGVPAATITSLPRIAKMTGAIIVPNITRVLPRGQGYVLTFYPPWENFPSGDDIADTRRMNQFIEQRVLEMPEQYFWLHKRFKTRPEGEARFY